MSGVFNRLKNWRWWVVLPIFVFVCFPFVVAPYLLFKLIGDSCLRISDWFYCLPDSKLFSPVIKAIDWIDKE